MPNNLPNILFIDDEPDVITNLQFSLGKEYYIEGVNDWRLAQVKLEKKSYDLILLDLDLENSGKYEKGFKNIALLKKYHPETPIIIVTNDRRQDTAVKAMDEGADYYLWKSAFDVKKWKKQIDKLTANKYFKEKLKQLERERQILHKRLNNANTEKYPFIGVSDQIVEVKETLKAIAQMSDNITVLLTGETGVGKEVAAHYFYANSLRNNHSFEAVNLSAITPNLLESTLFGHKKGAFTGATQTTKGYFEQADKGILFLDEIGEISLEIQVKLLRVIQDKKIRIVGDDKDLELDVQIITATNKDLKKAVEENEFRGDLLSRLKAYPVNIPPLRERKDDILPIAAHYLKIPEKLVEKNFFTDITLDKLMNYNWPGNIRELVNTIKYMEIRKTVKGKEQIDEECLPEEILNFKPEVIDYDKEIVPELSHEENLVLLDLKKIDAILRKYNGKKKEAAKIYGTDTDGLRYKIKTYYKKYPSLFKGLNNIAELYNTQP